ncbi:MAG: ADP-forming succinate--CoA ligase subunit beta [Verrucomicrobiota bacterium]
MNIHEYQARELLEKHGVNTPRGKVANTAEEAEKIAHSLSSNQLVIKAQVHAGGRGKGKFTSGLEGGVHVCKTSDMVGDFAKKMIGETLVTHQTGPEGKLVRRVMVAEAQEIDRELYFAILVDRVTSAPTIVASQQGGMDIEKVAEEDPEAIFHEPVDPGLGLQPYQSRKLARLLGFPGDNMRNACKLFHAAYNMFLNLDCSMLEINPLVVTKSQEVMALDAKINFDDSALFRHPEIEALRDKEEEDPREVRASEYHLNYIGLDGNIGCMVNGAGLAMATMDIIQHYGGSPANFLDVGGGADEKQVTEAFKILVDDPKVQAILVNIFGGIMKCDVIAQGIINAWKAVSCDVPLVVRLEGTNVDLGKKLLSESGLPIIAADGMADAAEKVVHAAVQK